MYVLRLIGISTLLIYCLVTAELYVQFNTTFIGESPIYILEGDIDNIANILPTFISCNFEFTQAVVAICEELLSDGGNGAVGIPENSGELIFAL